MLLDDATSLSLMIYLSQGVFNSISHGKNLVARSISVFIPTISNIADDVIVRPYHLNRNNKLLLKCHFSFFHLFVLIN